MGRVRAFEGATDKKVFEGYVERFLARRCFPAR
jgi:hypothetical protein